MMVATTGQEPASALQPLAFISHAHKDRGRPIVEALLKDLRTQIGIWLDEWSIRIGRRWDQEIEDGIRAATHVVFLASPVSVTREMVINELSIARENNKPIFPVLLEDCSLPYIVRGLQWVPFRTQEEYERNFARLLRDMGVIVADELQAMTAAPGMHREAGPAGQPGQLAVAAPGLHPEAALDVRMAGSALGQIQVQVSQIVTLNESIQAVFRGMILANPNPPRQWQDKIPEPAQADQLADLAARIDLDPQIRRDAVGVIAGLRSQTAIDRLTNKVSFGEDGAGQALALVRSETPLPQTRMHPAIRRRAFWGAVSLQLFETERETLLWRYVSSAVGSALAMGILQYALFNPGPFGQFAARRLNTALALGVLFGVLMGVGITAATEIASRLRMFPPVIRSLIGGIIGSVFASLAFIPITILYGERPFAEMIPLTLPGLTLLFVGGFALSSAARLNALLRAMIGAVGVFVAMVVGGVNPVAALVRFPAAMPPNEVLGLCVLFAVSVGAITFTPEFLTVIRGILRREPESPIRRQS